MSWRNIGGTLDIGDSSVIGDIAYLLFMGLLFQSEEVVVMDYQQVKHKPKGNEK